MSWFHTSFGIVFNILYFLFLSLTISFVHVLFSIIFFVVFFCYCVFFFFKQKTAYEMRISDWSSDVCSSDLAVGDAHDRDHAAGVDRVVSDRTLQPCSAPADAGVAGVDRLLPDLLHALRANLRLVAAVFRPRDESRNEIAWLALRVDRRSADFPGLAVHSAAVATAVGVVAVAGAPRPEPQQAAASRTQAEGDRKTG